MFLPVNFVCDPLVETFAVGRIGGPECLCRAEAGGVDELWHGHAEREDFAIAFGDAETANHFGSALT